jgi:hypothetical protein
MRYLYGDSVPFQLQYNFLTTLETFVACAAQAVLFEFEIQQFMATTAEAASARNKAIEELEEFHRSVMAAVRSCASRITNPVAADYTRQVQEYAVRLVEEHRRGYIHANEREQMGAQGEIERRRVEVRAAIEAFLTSARLPTVESKVSMRLDNTHNDFTAVFTNPLKIVTGFHLNAAQVPEWSAPRRVGEVVQGLAMQVGVKRSWITRKPQPEMIALDEFFFGGFELSSDAAQIRLRKRPDLKDSLIFKIRRVEGDLQVDVLRPEEEAAGDIAPPALDTPDRAQIERLWQTLRVSVNDVLLHKDRLRSIEIEGTDVFEANLVIPFLQRIIKMFAPIVAEIARRSPNSMELSLKTEDDNGRREEMYLRKLDLAARLEPLTGQARALFAPLALTREESLIDISALEEEDD